MTRPVAPPAEMSAAENLLFALVGVAVAGAAAFWAATGAAQLVTTGHWPHLPIGNIIAAMHRLPLHLADPAAAWPGPPSRPSSTAGAAAFYAVLAVPILIALGAWTRWHGSSRRPPGTGHHDTARWAVGSDMRRLTVRRTTGPGWPTLRRAGHPGRLVLGQTERGRRLIATEARHSVLVIGPTQSGKTTGLAVPAILEWEGPIVATSVKDDLAAHTFAWRSTQGPCAFFDPTYSASIPHPTARTGWSPLSACETWTAAQKMASWLVESTPGRRGMADAAFWYTTAGKQLAPLLLAAGRGSYTMGDIARWTDTQEFSEPLRLLQLSGDDQAALALAACEAREERIRSSIATTLETVLAPFADPVVASATARTDLSIRQILATNGTLYLCGPTHEQQRVQGLFAALVSSVIAEAITLTAERSAPLDPPLLLVLDEAANIAPIRDLDTIASTGAGLGIQLVTVCQDLAQLAGRYDAERARTIANNHRAKLLLTGVSDLGTLDLMSGLAGEQAVREATTTHDLRNGGRTRATTTTLRRLAPTDALRRVEPGRAVLIYGHLPPVRLRLRPWFRDRRLRWKAGYSDGAGLRARLGATRGGSPGIFG
jgi:type IV secretion system protein VirD4